MTLLGFLSYSGNIKIDGLEISAVQRDELRQRITTISQEQLKLAGSIRTNLCPYDDDIDTDPTTTASSSSSRKRKDQDAELRTLLERLRVWGAVSATRGGLDAALADAGLSHGQTQLLCVARAVLRRRATGARVVLVDEATSSVDPATDAAARRVMADEFAGCTVLTVAHGPDALAAADVRVELAQGRVRTVVHEGGDGGGGGGEEEEEGRRRKAEEEEKKRARRRELSMAAIAQLAKAGRREEK